MDEKLAQGRQRLHNMLHDDASQTDRLLTSVETGTGIAREHFVFAIVGIVAVYFLTGEHGQMASNTICLIVPNIVAYHAVRAGDSSKFGVLLVYWMTYAIIRVVDIIIVACDPHFLSIYWLLKTIGLLLLLFIPYSAQRIYNHFMATTTKEKHSKPAAEQQSPITGDIKAGKSIEQEPKSIAEEKPLSEPFPLPVVAAEKEEEEHTAIVEE
uniref:Receptor expression-enhancing protein n=1 Tax=Plectus sambesii TaxID=2011161 RepID=A0A914VLW9_9BILA